MKTIEQQIALVEDTINHFTSNRRSLRDGIGPCIYSAPGCAISCSYVDTCDSIQHAYRWKVCKVCGAIDSAEFVEEEEQARKASDLAAASKESEDYELLWKTLSD